jgi:hypothetical protein
VSIVNNSGESSNLVGSPPKESALYGDVTLYIKYKEGKGKVNDCWVYMPTVRKIRRVSDVQRTSGKFLDVFNFSYDDLLNGVEKLVYSDELNLSGEIIISVEERVFKELPPEKFKIQALQDAD